LNDNFSGGKINPPRSNKTYERSAILAAANQPKGKKVVDTLANDWESFQTSHFSQVEEFDLVFK
jgi:hypothetical protein